MDAKINNFSPSNHDALQECILDTAAMLFRFWEMREGLFCQYITLYFLLCVCVYLRSPYHLGKPEAAAI